MSLPPGCSLAAESGRTLIGGVAVTDGEADPVEAGDALADALAITVAEDDTRVVPDGYSSSPLRSALVLSSLLVSTVGDSPSFLSWFSLFKSSLLRSSSSTLPTRANPEGSWETDGFCTTETDGGSSPLMLEAR